MCHQNTQGMLLSLPLLLSPPSIYFSLPPPPPPSPFLFLPPLQTNKIMVYISHNRTVDTMGVHRVICLRFVHGKFSCWTN